MSKKWRDVKVFISSTFRDMHAERDHLVKVVFPELRARLEPHRFHLIDVDLRWGVTKEQADNDQVLDLCLQQIDECRPFFVGILGQRYGWIPKKYPLLDENKYGWTQVLTGKSITELEILHGVLWNPAMAGHAMFYFRDSEYLSDVPDAIRKEVYLDEHPDKLKKAKSEIRSYCTEHNAPLVEYFCRWEAGTVKDAHGRLAGLEGFGETVRDNLWDAMAKEYPEILQKPEPIQPDTENWLEAEQEFHERFMESRLRVYVGRDNIHQELTDYLESDSRQPLLLSGGSGTGKSAILARLCRDWEQRHPDQFVLPHFVGASGASTSHYMMLRRFCLILSEWFGFKQTTKTSSNTSTTRKLGSSGDRAVTLEVPDNPRNLPQCFCEMLAASPKEARVVIILDAANQIDNTGKVQQLNWLPQELPVGVKFIISCIDEPDRDVPALDSLRSRELPEFCVQTLTDEERQEVVKRIPSVSAKTLDPKQMQLLLDNTATQNPLYLIVALEELRGFGSFENLNERIRSFPHISGEKGLNMLFEQIIERLEQELNHELVCAALSYIAVSRTGLSEQELTALLDTDKENKGELEILIRQLRPYLLHRNEKIDFYHRNLQKAVCNRYLSGQDVEKARHKELAEWFRGLGLGSQRMLSESTYHMLKAQMWEELLELETSIEYMDAKVKEGMVLELIDEYVDIEYALPNREEERSKQEFQEKQIDVYVQDLMDYCSSTNNLPRLKPPESSRLECRKADNGESESSDKTLSERFKAFSRFVLQHAHSWQIGSGWDGRMATQQALNLATSDSVYASARSIFSHQDPNPMILVTESSRKLMQSLNQPKYLFEEHSGRINSLALSMNGRIAASASDDNTIRVWDLRTARCVHVLKGHNGPVRAISLTPDGKTVVSGGSDGTVQLWSAEQGTCLGVIENIGGGVNAVSITPDGHIAVISTGIGRAMILGNDNKVEFDNHVCILDLKTGSKMGECEVPENLQFHNAGAIRSISISPDGQQVTGIFEHGFSHQYSNRFPDTRALLAWEKVSEVDNWKCVGAWPDITSICMTPEGTNYITGDVAGTIDWWGKSALFSSNSKAEVKRKEYGSSNLIEHIAITPDMALAVLVERAEADKTSSFVKVLDLRQEDGNPNLMSLNNTVGGIAISADGRTVVSAEGATIHVWDLLESILSEEVPTTPHRAGIKSILLTSNGDMGISISDDCVRKWDPHHAESQLLNNILNMGKLPHAISSDGKIGVLGGENALQLVDLDRSKIVHELKYNDGDAYMVAAQKYRSLTRKRMHARLGGLGLNLQQDYHYKIMPVDSLCITLDGSVAVTASRQKNSPPAVWDLGTWTCRRLLGMDVLDAVLERDAQLGNNPIEIMRKNRMPDIDIEGIQAMVVTPDGKIAVTASDRYIVLWNLGSGRKERVISHQAGSVVALALSPDSRTLVSAGSDNILYVWELATGNCKQILKGHMGAVSELSITPDAEVLVSCGLDGVLRAWNLETGKCIIVCPMGKKITSMSAIASSGMFACGSAIGDVFFFELASLNLGPAFVTATMLLKAESRGDSFSADSMMFLCPQCRKWSTVPDRILEALDKINLDCNLSQSIIPSLELPGEVWEYSFLRSKCVCCNLPIKFTPFVCDTRGLFDA